MLVAHRPLATALRCLLVVLVVVPACYAVWFWATDVLMPPEFGMPDYEDELEFGFLAGTALFAVVPIWLSIKLCRKWGGASPGASSAVVSIAGRCDRLTTVGRAPTDYSR